MWEFARLFAAMACVNLVFPPQKKKNSNGTRERDIFMKNGNEIWDVLGDSRKRYRGPWAEIGKY